MYNCTWGEGLFASASQELLVFTFALLEFYPWQDKDQIAKLI